MQAHETLNPAASNTSRPTPKVPPALALNSPDRRSIAYLNAALIEIDRDGTIKAMNAGAAWLLRCSIWQFIGEPVARIIPALNRGLEILATAKRNGIALRADGKVIHVRTTGIPYQSKVNSGWRILIERS
jgi:nitrogen-specific signal transduction histidine kinase